MAMLWMAPSSRAISCGRKETGSRMFSWILVRLIRLFWTNPSFAHWHFYDPFALVSQICVRRDALALFGLYDDELLPDLHITGAGVLRAGLGAHQEHLVNQDAQAADRNKVPAEVIQVASHEVDTESDKDESIVATSGSYRSESSSGTALLLRWPLMLNSMSACNPPMLQWAHALIPRNRWLPFARCLNA